MIAAAEQWDRSTHGGACLSCRQLWRLGSTALPAPCPSCSILPARPLLQECALVERSINSARVSFRFKVADPVEAHLLKTFLRFMVHRWVEQRPGLAAASEPKYETKSQQRQHHHYPFLYQLSIASFLVHILPSDSHTAL